MNTTSYKLYLGLSALTIGIVTGLGAICLYLMWLGLMEFGLLTALIVEIIGATILFVPWLMWLVMLLATAYDTSFSPLSLRLSNRSLYVLFPLTVWVGYLCGCDKDRISQSFIDMINHLVNSRVYAVAPKDILLLTPHCLQASSCPHKVTTDVHNCKRCGKCKVGTLLDIADEYGCQFIVVTGGTLARLMIKERRPKAIVAIACERDLVSGMADVFPIPVMGVLNERPCGPCCNTQVDTDKIRKVVERLIYGTYNQR